MNLKEYPQLAAAVRKVRSSIVGAAVLLGLVFAGLVYAELRTYFYDPRDKWALGAAVLFLVLGVVTVVAVARSGKKAKQTWTRATREELQRLDSEAPYLEIRDHAMIASDGIVAGAGGKAVFLPYRDIVWVYGNHTTQRMYGIPVGHSYSVMVVDRYRNYWQIMAGAGKRIKKGEDQSPELEAKLERVLEPVRKTRPNVLVGYDGGYVQLAQQDFDRLVRIADGAE